MSHKENAERCIEFMHRCLQNAESASNDAVHCLERYESLRQLGQARMAVEYLDMAAESAYHWNLFEDKASEFDELAKTYTRMDSNDTRIMQMIDAMNKKTMQRYNDNTASMPTGKIH